MMFGFASLALVRYMCSYYILFGMFSKQFLRKISEMFDVDNF